MYWALNQLFPAPASTAQHPLRDHVCSYRLRQLRSLLRCETPTVERSALGNQIAPSQLIFTEPTLLLAAERFTLTSPIAIKPRRCAWRSRGRHRVRKRAAASSPRPFLSSAPPHEYTLSAPTGATACGIAAAASPLFSFSPSLPPLGSSALPQRYMLRSPPQEYALGSPTGAAACGNAAAASTSSSSSPSPPFTVFATVSAASPSSPLGSSAPPQQNILSAVSSAAIHTSLAVAAIHAWRSHGRHRVRQRNSRVDVLFHLAVASCYRVRNRNSRDAAASLRLLGATAATQFFCGFVFPSSFLPTAEIRSGPMGVPD